MEMEEVFRRIKLREINAEVKSMNEDQEHQRLILKYGKENVWDTEQLKNIFKVHQFLAPFVFVSRKDNAEEGTLMFQHEPRFYFAYQKNPSDEELQKQVPYEPNSILEILAIASVDKEKGEELFNKFIGITPKTNK